MELQIQRVHHGTRVFWVDGQQALVANGFRVFWMDRQGKRQFAAAFPAPWPARLLSRIRPVAQALRLGFHNLWPLPGGGMVGIIKQRLVKLDPGSQRFRVVGRLRFGNKPGFKGVCVDDVGTVFYGEYCQNMDRSCPSALYRSEDGGDTYKKLYEFPVGQVRHIHFIQWDSYGQCLWLGTGDRDQECRLLRSTNLGFTWEVVGSGSQRWRAVGLTFTPDFVYWGTDAGSDTGTEKNYIVRWSRSKGREELVQEMQGPCHGSGCLHDGTLLVSTGVEGGMNEKDDCAHLWVGRDGTQWQELAHWKKDAWSYLVQFGVLQFPHNLAQSSQVHFTARGLVHGGEAYHVGSVL